MAKTTKVSGWRSRSTGFLGGVAAVVLVVVLLGGMALGYEVEKSRVKSSPKTSAAARARARAKNGAKGAFAARATGARGTVRSISAKSISIKPKKGAAHKFTIGKGTIIVKPATGAMSDLTSSERVVFAGAGSLTKAKAIIVLPKSAKIGSLVSAVGATTMSLKLGKKTTKVTTTGATVEKVSPATLSEITKGAKVIVAGVRYKSGASVATEIIVLPGDTPFA